MEVVEGMAVKGGEDVEGIAVEGVILDMAIVGMAVEGRMRGWRRRK